MAPFPHFSQNNLRFLNIINYVSKYPSLGITSRVFILTFNMSASSFLILRLHAETYTTHLWTLLLALPGGSAQKLLHLRITQGNWSLIWCVLSENERGVFSAANEINLLKWYAFYNVKINCMVYSFTILKASQLSLSPLHTWIWSACLNTSVA